MSAEYNISGGRQPVQINRMQELANRGICAFCPDHIRQETDSPIELETEYWLVKKNDFPYNRTNLHLLFIPKAHVDTLAALSVRAQTELIPTIVEMATRYKLTSYAIGIRSGDMLLNGGTVEHLHAHLIVGDINNPDPEPVRFKMSSRPKSV